MLHKPKTDRGRIAKVNSLIERALGPVLRDFLEDESGFATITKVETSRDMKYAKVWISIFGGDDEKILSLLARKIYAIQGGLNRHFATKIIPRISFHLDTGPRFAEKIERIIKKIHEQ